MRRDLDADRVDDDDDDDYCCMIVVAVFQTLHLNDSLRSVFDNIVAIVLNVYEQAPLVRVAPETNRYPVRIGSDANVNVRDHHSMIYDDVMMMTMMMMLKEFESNDSLDFLEIDLLSNEHFRFDTFH